MFWLTSPRGSNARFALLALVAAQAACYTEYPLSMAVPAPAARIVAQVTDTGTVAMGNAIGAGALEIEGIVADVNGDAWRLHMIRVDQRGGTSTQWNRETVTFPRYALTNVREKRIDKRRSWMAAGLVALGAFAVSRLFGPLITGGGPDPDPPPPA